MKTRLFIVFVLVFTGCSTNKEEKKSTIQGMFVARFETEYNKGMDTIEITPFNSERGTFNYVRLVGYRRITNHGLGPFGHKTETSTCIFKKQTAQLNEQRYGRNYSFSNNGNQLVSGNSIYKRVQ